MITQQNMGAQVEQVCQLPQQSTIYPTSQLNNNLQCRICLEMIKKLSAHVISPCKCSGSIKYVHFKCMSQWICHNVQKPMHESTQRDYFPCQMCRQHIIFDTQAQIQCVSCIQLKQLISDNKRLFFGLLFLSISLLLLFFYCIILTITAQVINLYNQSWFQSILIIFSLFLVLVIQLISTYYFFKKFIFIFKIFIVKIHSQSNTRITRNRSSSMSNSQANLMSVRRNARMVSVEPIIENLQ